MDQYHGTAKFLLVVTLILLCGAFAYELGWERGSQAQEFSEPAPPWLRGHASSGRPRAGAASAVRNAGGVGYASPLSDDDDPAENEPLITPAAAAGR